ncbi:hypothetical protein BH24ACI3_BH24ACI3_11880 [soil metagenome]
MSPTADEQRCPICSAAVEPNVRYKNYVCFNCCALAVDEEGRKLGFGNESFSGGFAAWYADTNETREGHVCFIKGIKCWADEAHMGGIAIRIYGGEKD